MYKGIKSKIFFDDFSSDLFTCNVGVRQGESLSLFLFSLYINDLEDYVTRLSTITEGIEKELFYI